MSSGSSPSGLAGGGPRSIRFRIVTLVLLVLGPMLALFGWVALDLARERMHAIEIERAEAAGRISDQVDREIARTVGALTALAVSDDILLLPEEFKRQAASVTLRLGLVRVLAFDRAGATLLETAPPATGSPGLDADLVERTFRGQRSVSHVRGDGLEHATVLLTAPVVGAGGIEAGLAAEMHLLPVNRVISESGLADGWVAAVVDRKGRFVGRSLDAGRRVGLPARPELAVAANAASGSGTFENVTLEGTAMLNSFRRSPMTDWTAVVAVPTAIVHAPLRRNALLVVLVGATALLLTIGAAFGYATRISEPVRNLGLIAAALAKGRPVPTTHYPLAELDEVRKAIESATAESAHLAALVNSSGDAIMSMDLDGNIRSWNPAAERLFGYTAAEIIGRPKALLVPPDRIEELHRQQARVAAGESVRSETVRCARNGTPIAVSVASAPIRRPDGTIIAMSSILHDITERIANEEHRLFLMREIAHRSKNQLAIIQAIAMQTARASGSLLDFLAQFRGRLQGLSASHDLLLNQNWHGAPLDELVRSQIAVFVDGASSAVSVAGPPAMLHAAAAEAVGLAIHELATNSVKYGALSVPAGKVAVAWREVARSEAPRSWELTWQESGGPPVSEPSGSGFGTQVVKRMAAMAVQGKAELEYREGGLFWRLEFPASALRSPPTGEGARPRERLTSSPATVQYASARPSPSSPAS